jgi:hypothetical protein
MTVCLQGKVTFRPAKPIRSAASSSSGQRLGAEAQGLEVDELVDVAQPLLGALLLVQRRGARGLDAGADQPDHEGGAGVVDRRRVAWRWDDASADIGVSVSGGAARARDGYDS